MRSIPMFEILAASDGCLAIQRRWVDERGEILVRCNYDSRTKQAKVERHENGVEVSTVTVGGHEASVWGYLAAVCR